MRRIFAVLMVMFLLIPASAQPNIPLDEYLRAVNDAFDTVDNAYSFDGSMLRLLVEKELVQRYGTTPDVSAVPLDLLVEANSHLQGMYISLDAYGWWRGLVRIWLNGALDPQHFEIGYYDDIDSEIELYDFEADGVPEMLIHGRGTVEAYIGTRWDGRQWSEFNIPLTIDVPASHPQFMTASGSLREIGFDDANGDGLPEWRVLSIGSGCQGCFMEVGEFYVLGWRDGSLIQLVAPVSYVTGTDGVEWDFGGDGFVKRQEFRDSWGCIWHGEDRYHWDDATGLYVFVSDSLNYEDSFECGIRVAEKANWAGELEAAGILYELAVSRVPVDLGAVDLELYQYTRLRLAIVDTLTGQHDRASALVDALGRETPQSQFVADILAALRGNIPDPYRTCTAVYNLFTRNYAAFSSLPNGSIPTEMTIGYVLDDVFPNSFYRPLPTPDKAGCNVERLVAQVVIDGLFFAQSTPRAILESHRLAVADERLVDIDGDGVQDFVVWLTADIPAFVFYPQHFNSAGLPLVERMEIALPAPDLPFALPTPSPTPDANTTVYAPDADRFPCDAGASCDMLDPKTVYVLMEEVTDLTYRGAFNLPPAEPRLRRALETAFGQGSPSEYPLRYLWGLILEEHSDPDAARAEFAAIIDAAPDSAWAILAALHVR